MDDEPRHAGNVYEIYQMGALQKHDQGDEIGDGFWKPVNPC
jgi:hypothetical protein